MTVENFIEIFRLFLKFYKNYAYLSLDIEDT